MEKNEQLFYDKLKDIFIGVKIEGNSGFVNLMRIKSLYFNVVFEEVKKEIDEKLKPFEDFREELYDKLNTFFSNYFSESGSIYFSYTPLKSKIYDKIYTQQGDVVLFWKTRMLYYVKTDKLWQNLIIDYDNDGLNYKIEFDVSKLEHKSGNEKKEIIYELKSIEEQTIKFYVLYSEKGRKTDKDKILKEMKNSNVILKEDDLDNIFKVYGRQNDIDYFINKDAKSFLKEQFDLWLKNYIFDDQSDFSEQRIKELKVLKDIAYKVIDFVSQFEDELVKIWNKPKFVLNSNYVITLDRIEKHNGIEIIKKIISNSNIQEQINEWKDLGIVDQINLNEIIINDSLNYKYKFLPIDTKYFKDLELKILSLFDNLDDELDGRLIHSENYQALNTILPKFKVEVKTVYIDPPYNTGNDEFMYLDQFKQASWLTMLENRLQLSKELMKDNGTIFISIANNANQYAESYALGLMLETLFDKRLGDLIWQRRSASGSYVITDITEIHEYIFCFGNKDAGIFKNIMDNESLSHYSNMDEKGQRFKWQDIVIHQYTKGQRPNLYYGVVYNFKENKLDFLKETSGIDPSSEVIIYPSADGTSVFAMTKKSMEEVYKRKVIQVFNERNKYKIKIMKYLYDENGLVKGNPLKSIISENKLSWQIGTTSEATKELNDLLKSAFSTAKPSSLIKLLLYASTFKNSMILDFFAGSGTTAHAVMKLNKEDGGKRKFILIEMADYSYNIILPRVKKIAYSFNWKDGKPLDNDGIGIFVKYYDLEQYEQTLRRCHYIPSEPFFNLDDKSIYEQYVFLKDSKLLDAMELDYKDNKIKINFDKIYPNIDLAETLSLIKGKKIRKIEKDAVTFDDNERIEYNNIDFKTVKPLIWW